VVAQGPVEGRRVRRPRGAGQARRELHAAGSGRRARKGAAGNAKLRQDGAGTEPMIPNSGISCSGSRSGWRWCWASCRWSARRPAAQLDGAGPPRRRLACSSWSASFAAWSSSFVTHDFSVLYVAQNSNSALPLEYRITAVWGGHEGSLLLWLDAGGLDGGCRAVSQAPAAGAMVARILSVMGWCRRLSPVHAGDVQPLRPPAAGGRRRARPESAAAGSGHDHPPADALHGLRGFSVAFASRSRRSSAATSTQWARWTRPWTTSPGSS
jgi:hypothetical protein